MIIIFSTTGGLMQLLPSSILFPDRPWLLSPFYIGVVALLFLSFERLGINEKRVHPTLAVSFVTIAVVFDFVTGKQF